MKRKSGAESSLSHVQVGHIFGVEWRGPGIFSGVAEILGESRLNEQYRMRTIRDVVFAMFSLVSLRTL